MQEQRTLLEEQSKPKATPLTFDQVMQNAVMPAIEEAVSKMESRIGEMHERIC